MVTDRITPIRVSDREDIPHILSMVKKVLEQRLDSAFMLPRDYLEIEIKEGGG